MSEKNTTKQANEYRDNYLYFEEITTRWMDNDAYGHVNNVTYYSYFDTVTNSYLMSVGGLDIEHDPVIGFIVNSGCNYKIPIAFPDVLDVGLRVEHIGNSSVQYGLAIFKRGQAQAAAFGHLVHVFVDRETNKPQPIPEKIRKALKEIFAKPSFS
ncbi:MAG: acyl-CoA thioester hydrolase [Paraglaciecola sp.]|jgi:acyl-CoA thioester hydrolase